MFEADYNALYDLYQNLECIQEKLDELKAQINNITFKCFKRI